eukprot:GEMP01019204.1.p1 GENE.GEMP01019204.1~~GEMP01019204.1.p1  ORF type:complete len:757 (+),score=148.72 GEMP01019204.1:258-2528(+)
MYTKLARDVNFGASSYGGHGVLGNLDSISNTQAGYGMHFGQTLPGKNTTDASPPPASPLPLSSNLKGLVSPRKMVRSPISEGFGAKHHNGVRDPYSRDSRGSSVGRTTPRVKQAFGIQEGSPRTVLEGTRTRDKSNFMLDDRDGPKYARMTIAQTVRNRSLSGNRKMSTGSATELHYSFEKPVWVPSGKLNRGSNSMASVLHSDHQRSQSSTPRRSRDLLFADLYDDAVARRCRSLLDTRQKEEAERDANEDRTRNFQESLIQPWKYRLKDQRTHSERERDFAKRKQEFLMRCQEENTLRQQREVEQCSFHPNITRSSASQGTNEKSEYDDKRVLYLAAMLGVCDTSAAVRHLFDKEKEIFRNLQTLSEEQAKLPERLQQEYVEVRDRIQMEETKKVIEFLNLDEGKDYLRQRVAELQKPPAEAQAVIVNDLVQSSHSRVQEKVMTRMHLRRKELESNLELRKLKLQHELDHIRKAKRSLKSPTDEGLPASYRQPESDLITAELGATAPPPHGESFNSLPTSTYDARNSSSAPSENQDSARPVVPENNPDAEQERELEDHGNYGCARGQAEANERIFRSDSESSLLHKNRVCIPPAHSIFVNTTSTVVPSSPAAPGLSTPCYNQHGESVGTPAPIPGGQHAAIPGAHQQYDSRKIVQRTSPSNNFGNPTRAFLAPPINQWKSGTSQSSAQSFPQAGVGLGIGTPQSLFRSAPPAVETPRLMHRMSAPFANFAFNRPSFQRPHTVAWGSPQNSGFGL